MVSSREKLFQGATRVGEDFSRCTPTTASKTAYRCVGSYTLARGTIQFSGTIGAEVNPNRLRFVGGTGAYKDARGAVIADYNEAGTKAKETLTFT